MSKGNVVGNKRESGLCSEWGRLSRPWEEIWIFFKEQ